MDQQQKQKQEDDLTKSSLEVILSPPTLLDKIVDDPRCPSVGSLTHSGYINAMQPSGPQLCYSPCINPGYSSLGEINPDIQFSGDEGGDEDDSGSSRVEETKVYSRRWYVLFLYCLLAATQGGIWNVFGPIAATTEDIFDWNDGTIALLSNWGPISYLLGGVFFSWMMDVKGLRMACVISAVLTAVGAALKCFIFTTPWVTVLAHIAQFLNGLAGPVAMAAPPILSAVWFPPKERTTATAIGTIFNFLGVAISFIMGPLLVPDVTNSTTTMSRM